DRVRLNGLLNFPIVDGVLAGKIYAGYETNEDYIRNLYVSGGDTGGQSIRTLRGALLFTPAPDVSLYLTADNIRNRSSQQGMRNVSGPTTISCTLFQLCAPEAGLFGVTGAGYLTPNSS